MASSRHLPVPDAPLLLRDEAEHEILVRTGRPVDPSLSAKAVKDLLLEVLNKDKSGLISEPKYIPVATREVPTIENKLIELAREVGKFKGKAHSKTYRKLDTRLDHVANRIISLGNEVSQKRSALLNQVLNIQSSLELKTDPATDSEMSDQEEEYRAAGNNRQEDNVSTDGYEDALSHDQNQDAQGRDRIRVDQDAHGPMKVGSPFIHSDEDARRSSCISDNADAHGLAENFLANDETIRRLSIVPPVNQPDPSLVQAPRHVVSHGPSVDNYPPYSLTGDMVPTCSHARFVSNNTQPSPRRELDLYKWGITFSGDGGESLASFLCQVEDRCRSRNISPELLYKNCAELFTGSALAYYRAFRDKCNSWSDLIEKLRVAFQDRDYDYKLREEIRNRKQGSNESVSLFIAKMLNLFTRLSKPMRESEQLEIIEHNLLDTYQRPLALSTHRTLDELHRFLLKIEVGEARATGNCSNHKCLEPDLQSGCTPNKSSDKSFPNRTTPLAAITHPVDSYSATPQYYPRSSRQNFRPSHNHRVGQNINPSGCWNCGGSHRFRQCNRQWKLFCHGCGLPDVRSRTCPRCSGNAAHPPGTEAGGRGIENLRTGLNQTEATPNLPSSAQE